MEYCALGDDGEIVSGAYAQDPSPAGKCRSVKPERRTRRANWDNKGDGGVGVA